MSIAPSHPWDGITLPHVRNFTITLTGTPKVEDDVPTFDVRDPEQREAFRDAVLPPFDRPTINYQYYCGRCGHLNDNGCFCECMSPEDVKAWQDRVTPPACTCGPDEACDACADEAVPTDTSNVAVLIEVSPSGDGYIAQPEHFSQFGVGDTPYEALSDFFAVMAEHMDFLQRHEMSLTRGLANELGYLRTLAGNGRI